MLTDTRSACIIKIQGEGQINLKKGDKTTMKDLEVLARAIKNLSDRLAILTEVLMELIEKL